MRLTLSGGQAKSRALLRAGSAQQRSLGQSRG